MRKNVFLTSMLALVVASPAFADDPVWPYGVGIKDGDGYIGALTAAVNGTAVTTAACKATPLTYNSEHPDSGTFTFTADWSADECEIVLNENNGDATWTLDPKKLWTKFNSGAYTDSSRTHLMTVQSGETTPDYGVAPLPLGEYVSITWNYNAPTSPVDHTNDVSVSNAGTPASATRIPFLGFYENQSASEPGSQYINAAGYITTPGHNSAKNVAKNNAGVCQNPTWYGQWGCVNYTNPTLSLDGYTFDGWYNMQQGGTQDTGGCTNKGKNLYAHWSPIRYSVTYVCGSNHFKNGLTWDNSDYSGGSAQDDVYYDTSYTFRTPGNTCYWDGNQVSDNWRCTTDTGDNVEPWFVATNWDLTENVTCVADWAGIHSLTYNCNNGNLGTVGGGTNPQGDTYTAGEEITILSNKNNGGCIKPEGKSFNGWSCDGYTNNCNTDNTCTIASAPDNDISCTAQWETNEITLIWKKDENSDPLSTTTCMYDSNADEPGGIGQDGGGIPTPTKTGYTFKGWVVTNHED